MQLLLGAALFRQWSGAKKLQGRGFKTGLVHWYVAKEKAMKCVLNAHLHTDTTSWISGSISFLIEDKVYVKCLRCFHAQSPLRAHL